MMRVNGQSWGCVSAGDRGLAYGDGVFRTMLIRNKKILQWSRHYAKLAVDCAQLGIQCPPESLFWDDIMELARTEPDAIVKLIVTRGEGQRGYAPPSNVMPNRVVLTSRVPVYPATFREQGVTIRLCELRLSHQPRLAGIKHLNRLEYVLARAEWQDKHIAEGVLLDQREYLVGGTMTNILLARGNALYTPLLEGNGVAGVTRARLLVIADELGMHTSVERLTVNDLLTADEVMLCNSVIGVWPVRSWGRHRWQLGPITTQLCSLLEREDG